MKRNAWRRSFVVRISRSIDALMMSNEPFSQRRPREGEDPVNANHSGRLRHPNKHSGVLGPRLRGDDRKRGVMRRSTVAILGLLAALAIAPASAQDNYPSRVVRVVVPFPPGSGTDLLSRLVTDQLARKWNASVITENVPGASGNLGAADVFRSAPRSEEHTSELQSLRHLVC